ncbi:hypothetical protein NEOLEDRAFT_489991 [Neolentinus lepideus HHB14362 ss-1]|uniref:Uncharacterized protein n=1 Tax=Neolentinus lepideus HHB14362 ss-1 TaxID=1314782 RepID=A0A165VP23_9AGAM|nr:hypothetical protein NEOLEDRAFT_489991 [Neolentinus lepideus HHB14362 ss-1]
MNVAPGPSPTSNRNPFWHPGDAFTVGPHNSTGHAQYAPPPGPPPLDSFDEPVPAEAPPPYSKNAPIVFPESPSVFTTINLPPTAPTYLPLDPPPSCFSTPTPIRIRSRSFVPFRIPSTSSRIRDGFKPFYPPELLAKHGITEGDWGRFLADVRATAQLAERGTSAVAPYRFITGPLLLRAGGVGRQYNAAFAKTPVEEVKGLLDVWNGSAFERRKLRVTLMIRADEANRSREGYDLFVEAL